MPLKLTDEQRIFIVKLIKNHVETEKNCRVGWAMKQVLGDDFDKSVHNMEKIANELIETGEYIKEPSLQVTGDINIFKNPSFRKLKWIEKNPIRIELIKGTITLIVSVTASIITSIITTKNVMNDISESQHQEQQASNKQAPLSEGVDTTVQIDSIHK